MKNRLICVIGEIAVLDIGVRGKNRVCFMDRELRELISKTNLSITGYKKKRLRIVYNNKTYELGIIAYVESQLRNQIIGLTLQQVFIEIDSKKTIKRNGEIHHSMSQFDVRSVAIQFVPDGIPHKTCRQGDPTNGIKNIEAINDYLKKSKICLSCKYSSSLFNQLKNCTVVEGEECIIHYKNCK